MGPLVLARSNAPQADALVRRLAWDQNAATERAAYEAGDLTGLAFAHVVLEIRGAVPRSLQADPAFHVARGENTAWIGATLGDWCERLNDEAFPADLRSTIAGTIARNTSLQPFGDSRAVRYLATSSRVTWLEAPPAADEPAAQVWGGIVAVTCDAATRAALEKGGARILRAAALNEPTPWLDTNGKAGRHAVADALALPPADPPLSDAETRALKTFEQSYARIHRALQQHPGLRAALIVPAEASRCLIACDRQAATAVAEHPDVAVAALGRAILAQFKARADAAPNARVATA